MGSGHTQGGEGLDIVASSGHADLPGTAGSASNLSPNMSLVLAVASSPINRIVVSRIVQQTGLKVVDCRPEEAQLTMEQARPCMVILDFETDGACAALLPALSAERDGTPHGLPLLVALACTADADALCAGHEADAVVARPITPEALQPVIDRLVAKARRAAAG